MSDSMRNHAGGLSPIQREDAKAVVRPGQSRVAPIANYVPFPLDALPAVLREIVVNYSSAIGCDSAFVAMPMLPMLASCIGNARRIQLKRSWNEPPILWALTVASSGTGKTPAFDAVMKPLMKRQQRAVAEYQKAMATYEVELDRYEAGRDKRGRSNGPSEPLSRPVEPVAVRSVCSDTTVEAIAILLRDQPRGLILARDEGSGWFQGFDRYSQAKGGDVAHWLEMFSASSMTVDRKTGKNKLIFVPRASVSIAGGVQPGVLRRVLGRQNFTNGLAARFLFACPPRTQRRWTDDEVTPEMEARLESIVGRLFSLEMSMDEEENPSSIELLLEPEAKQRFIYFVNEHGAEQMMMTEDRSAAWSKLEGYAARLALVVHLSRWAAGESVDPGVLDLVSMQLGIALTEWFCNETLRVYSMLEATDEEDELRSLAEMVRACGGETTLRDWQRRRHHADRAAAEAELQLLVEADFGRWRHATPKATGGHPSKCFQLRADQTMPDTPAGSEPEGVLSLSRRDALDTHEALDDSDGTLVAPTVRTTGPTEAGNSGGFSATGTALELPASGGVGRDVRAQVSLPGVSAGDSDRTPAESASGQVAGTGSASAPIRWAAVRAFDWYESIEESAEVRVA